MKTIYVALISVILAFAAWPAAAQTLYLHSPSEEQTADGIVTGLKSAREAHLAALDRHAADITSGFARERDLVTRRALAQRDSDIARYLEKSGADPAAARTDLTRIMRYRLGTLLGADVSATGFATKLRNVVRARDNLDEALQFRDRDVDLERIRGGTGVTCDDTGTATTPISSSAADMCKDVRNSYVALFKQLPCGDGSIKALVAIARVQQCLATNGTKTDIAVSGELGDASRQASLIATARQAQRTLSAATRDRLRVLGCRLSEAEARRGQDGQSLIDAAKQLDDFIKEIEQLWSRSDTATPDAQATALVATLRSATPPAGGEASTCKAPASDAAGLAQLDGTLGPLFQALAALKPGRALIGKLRAETESFRAGKLGDLLNIASDPAAALANPDATTGAHVVALVFGSEANINTIIQAARGTLPDTSGILIELAEARMRAAVSQAEGDRIGQLEHLLTLRVVAYRQEIAGLMAAIDASEGGPESRMLLTYSDSFQQGRVPVAVLERESQHVELVAWMQRERAAIEAAYTVLDTAAGQIKVSTAGGIKTEDIARLLNVAGLAAIAGTN